MGLGRRLRPLGPLSARIEAPRERVFDAIAVPYLSPNPPRDLREKIGVTERDGDSVVAAHRTKVGRITVVTVEEVAFSRPEEVRFRLIRGPVPYVAERFVLTPLDQGRSTRLDYSGELGTDLWLLGEVWGRLVAHHWERVVAQALASLKHTCDGAAARAEARMARS